MLHVLGAHWAYLAVIDHTQQLGLMRYGHGLEFVQKEHSIVCSRQQSDMVAVRARERAPAVTEELALEQLCGSDRAVVGKEGPARQVGVAVNRSRRELFAGAGRALQQHVNVATCGHGNGVADLDDGPADTDDLGEPVV